MAPSPNDRTIHNWQLYAGRYDVKTTDAHLTSIRDFEMFYGCNCFTKLRDQDAGLYRNWLVDRGNLQPDKGGLSSSTIRHRASHLASFFNWLLKQEGYRRLSPNIPDQFDLPKRQMAKVLPRENKAYPTLEEAKAMVDSMPSTTRLQRRDRAMVALAFLTALRAGALVTLRLKHLNVEAQTVTQDGTEMRAKNGKSLVVQWFPGVEVFEPFVTEWKAELEALGFNPADALFPDGKHIRRRIYEDEAIPPLRTNGPINQAFAIASAVIGKAYSPHSARHCLKALGDQLCDSAQERKAWSLNMGHESEVITNTHYGKMTSESRMQTLGQVGKNVGVSDNDIELMLKYTLNELAPGTPEHNRAKKLVRQREDLRDETSVIE
ncbi:tyrosine-type recombinase/integrase [Parasedimentitalea huanghaiensis]|uniref:tyrosine-type recombinase/integrase n=1 Tax=Parasedimentitalea huanghaiensis TaxID=2682100 RepID=UPI003158FBB4